jgi:hypothetical protein
MQLTERLFLVFVFSMLSISLASGADSPAKLLDQPWYPKPATLPAPTGEIIRVTSVDELFRAADAIKPGGTIFVADGNYLLPRVFDLHTDNVTLRSESGHREKVVLDGKQSMHVELISITRCSGVTIADLTIQNSRANGFKINSDLLATKVKIRNCVIHNIWQRGVKGPGIKPAERERIRPSDCRIEFCLFYNDRAKTFDDDPTDTPKSFGGNYVGGIDAMFAGRWTICDNVFLGIQGRTREARGAVFLWQDAEECIVERNVIIDCDSGICLGNGFKPTDIEWHARGCIVRNNFVTRCPEQGILAEYTKDCRIVHNSIHDPESRFKRLIRLVHTDEGLIVANNLLSGPEMRMETPSKVIITGNVTGDMTSAFVNAAAGDLHLKDRSRDLVNTADAQFTESSDIDGHKRGAKATVGAHEVGG